MDGVLMDDPPTTHSRWLMRCYRGRERTFFDHAFDQAIQPYLPTELMTVVGVVVMLLAADAYYAHLHIQATNYDGPAMWRPFVALHNAFASVC